MRSAARVFLVLAVVVLLLPSAAGANERAMTVPLSNGDTYYVYLHGGEFPTGHGAELWQETNGLLDCGVPEGVFGHVEPMGETGLQVKPGSCNGTPYQPDTRLL